VKRDNSFLGLIGGETKGEADAPCTAMVQAIPVACDFLFHAVHVLGVPVTDAVIPFVVLSGGLVQFGAVYSLASEFYPVPVLLTEPMPVYPKTELYLVLEGLAKYILTQMLTWPPDRRVSPSPNHLLRLRTAGYFFKPLQLFGQHFLYARHQLRQLLGVFDALYKCEALRTSVVFPVGFIGFPGPGPATTTFLGEQFRSGLEKAIGSELLEGAAFESAASQTCEISRKRKATSSGSSDERGPRKKQRVSDDNDAYRTAEGSVSHDSDDDQSATDGPLPPGYPIVVYPRLEAPWRVAGNTCLDPVDCSPFSTVNVPRQYRASFYDKVCRLVDLMAEAGVCHLDVRLNNLFYRVEHGEVHVKVIDFDFAWRMNYQLPAVFREWIDDTRNAFPKSVNVAGRQWLNPMMAALRTALEL
jgi:hypothetical protein